MKPFHIKYVGAWAGEGFVLGAILALSVQPSSGEAYNPFQIGLVLAFASVVYGLGGLLVETIFAGVGFDSAFRPEWLWYVYPVVALLCLGLWFTLFIVFLCLSSIGMKLSQPQVMPSIRPEDYFKDKTIEEFLELLRLAQIILDERERALLEEMARTPKAKVESFTKRSKADRDRMRKLMIRYLQSPAR